MHESAPGNSGNASFRIKFLDTADVSRKAPKKEQIARIPFV